MPDHSLLAVPASLLTLALNLLTPAAPIPDEVKIPGSRFGGKRAAAGKAFKAPGWKLEGAAHWVERAGREGDHALALAPKSRLTRRFPVKPLAAPKGARHQPAAESWRAVLTLDLSLPARSTGRKSAVHVRLAPANGETAVEGKRAVTRDDFTEALHLVLPASELVAGDWKVEITVVGKVGVVIDDLRLVRVPVVPEEMRFAKPNGKNGPDRLESGALGFVGWTAHEHGPLPIKAVRDGGPAAKAGLRAGDLVVAVQERALPRNSCKPGFAWFEHGHEAVLGRAVEEASAWSEPRIKLGVLRGDREVELVVTPTRRAPLPETFPFDDEVTPALYRDVIDFVRRTRKKRGFWKNGGNEWIQTSFAGLALLGRRDPADAEIVRETADWFLQRFPTPESFGNLGYWAAAYSGIFMCEYLLASGDERVKPWIASALHWIEAGFHTSKWGMPALGHGPSGLPYGQKALMAPASHVLVFEALAKKAGIDSSIQDTLWPYVAHSWSDPAEGGHGAMGYNGSFRDKGEFWSRTGLVALALALRGERDAMRRHLTGFMRGRHQWMRNSHAYGNPGDTWGLIGLATCDREAFKEVMEQWRWAFGGAWQPGFGLRHTTAHMGSPYMGGEGLINPAFATLLSARHRGLFITGASDQDRGWMKLSPRPTPRTPVLVEWTESGQVSLRAVIPGSAIVYTTDGTEPRADAKRYRGPFSLPQGGTVKARTKDTGDRLGKVSERRLAPSKAKWKVLRADGAATPEVARARARFLIDGETWRPWQPDRGQGSEGLPLGLTLDFGSPQRLRGLVLLGKNLPREIAVAWGDGARGNAPKTQRFETTGKKDARVVFAEPVRTRFLRLEILSLRKGKKLRFGELDLLRD